jgi:hypothetical protein
MQELPPEYLAEIARQIAFVSAFLGGFAATFLGTLLFAPSERRIAAWAISSSAMSACAFIVTVLALSMLVVNLRPDAPAAVVADAGQAVRARIVGFFSFMLGMYSLLASIGLSGWLRSRRLGWLTTMIALVAAILATWTIAYT